MAGWLLGNPTDWGWLPMSLILTGSAPSFRLARIPLPEGEPWMWETCSSDMPLMTKSDSSPESRKASMAP